MAQTEEPTNLVSLWENSVARYPDNRLFGVTNQQRDAIEWFTYSQIDQRVTNCRAGLKLDGLRSGESVGIIADNRPEWTICAFATYGLGGRFVPMYEKELHKVWKYIIQDSTIKILFVANQTIYQQVKELQSEIATLKKIYVIDSDEQNSLAHLEQRGSQHPIGPIYPQASDTAGLIYTSGTTGDPKGVLLSHGNFTYNATQGSKTFAILNQHDRSLSILPWAHSYGQTGELYNFIYMGASMGFMHSVDTLAEDFQLVQPTMLLAVPRLFNKIYDGIWAKMNQCGGAKRALFVAAVNNAKKRRALAKNNKSNGWVNLKHQLYDKLVFSKIRQRFGGQLRAAFTASAVMNLDIADFFRDIGIPTFDAYGLTETSPCVSINTMHDNRPGSVGKILPGQRVVIDKSVVDDDAKDGEIIVYGPNVMQGYHNKPDETKAVLTPDGGFRTGDRGRLDDDGYLYITGRIKEQYKLSNGKYVFPASIEEDLKLLNFVSNAFVYGMGRTFNICIVVPDMENLALFAKKIGKQGSPEQLLQVKSFTDLLSEQITSHLKTIYGGYEVPKKYLFVTEDFSLENGMLTQTMKLKRNVVFDKYKNQIESLYN